jgi:hypothetical protein
MGVKSQIASAAKDLANVLRRYALKSAADGDNETAVKDLVRAIRVIEPLRYSDTGSVAVIDNYHRRTLLGIKGIWPSLTDNQKATLRPVIAEITPDKARFEEVVRADRRLEVVYKIQAEDISRAMPNLDKDQAPRAVDGTLMLRVATTNEQSNAKLIAELLR